MFRTFELKSSTFELKSRTIKHRLRTEATKIEADPIKQLSWGGVRGTYSAA